MEKNHVQWFRIVFALVVLAALLAFLVSIKELVKVVVISAVLAYIIDPVAIRLEARGMSRTQATVIIFSSFVLIVVLFFLLFLPVFTAEISAVQEGLASGQADVMLSRIERLAEEKLGFLGVKDLQLNNRIHEAMVRTGDWVFAHMLDVVSLLTSLVLMPIFVFFLLKDGRQILKQIIRLIPNRYFEFSLNLFYKMDIQLGNYLRGQFLDAVIFGILSVITLWVLGVKYYLLIGIFAGMANLVPFLGPVAGASLAVLISVIDTGDFVLAAYVIISFAVIKLIDDAIVQPLVLARSVHMHPLVVLLAVIIGGKFFGILGMILSVPVTGFIKVALKESFVNFRRFRLSS